MQCSAIITFLTLSQRHRDLTSNPAEVCYKTFENNGWRILFWKSGREEMHYY